MIHEKKHSVTCALDCICAFVLFSGCSPALLKKEPVTETGSFLYGMLSVIGAKINKVNIKYNTTNW